MVGLLPLPRTAEDMSTYIFVTPPGWPPPPPGWTPPDGWRPDPSWPPPPPGWDFWQPAPGASRPAPDRGRPAADRSGPGVAASQLALEASRPGPGAPGSARDPARAVAALAAGGAHRAEAVPGIPRRPGPGEGG
jgi:hypothetical protein